ncbi:hypothetical protein [Nocardioides eburneiflavus]|uniref:hypothetical protein n=1 Tax=Nocardioides eburneiflavus TaxID=2518372 RepID=UPI00143CD842|nr:hypothetical protein [Nocardioides eburneiflavus]
MGRPAPACMAFVSTFDEGGTPGLFGPSRTVGPTAPLVDHLLARSGRDPQWSPA